jgi:transcriptional regulator with XRE-family HTH domain
MYTISTPSVNSFCIPLDGLQKNNFIHISKRMDNKIDFYRKKAGLTVQQLADDAGISRNYLQKLKVGDKRLNIEIMEKLADVLGCSSADLITSDEKSETPVVGYAGAGIVYAFDDHLQGAGLEYVDTPQGINNKNLVAVRVKGDSMRPMMLDGWLVFYGRDCEGVPPDCVGRVCIVKLAGDGVAVREVKQGSKPNHYHLVAYNGETTFDAQLTWASRVLNIRPS